jgi:hypothetical protein
MRKGNTLICFSLCKSIDLVNCQLRNMVIAARRMNSKRHADLCRWCYAPDVFSGRIQQSQNCQNLSYLEAPKLLSSQAPKLPSSQAPKLPSSQAPKLPSSQAPKLPSF